MPRRIFPAGTVTNTTGAPLRLTFYATSTTGRRETDLWTVDGSSNLSERIPNGVIITDTAGAYGAFAGPDDIDTLYRNAHTGVGRTAITATSYVSSFKTEPTLPDVMVWSDDGVTVYGAVLTRSLGTLATSSSTDGGLVLQSAINLLRSRGGQVGIRGLIPMATGVTLYPPVALVGQGLIGANPGVTNTCQLIPATALTGAVITVTADSANAAVQTFPWLQNFTISGPVNYGVGASSDQDGVYFTSSGGHVLDCIMSGVGIFNVGGAALHVNDSSMKLWANQCYFENCALDGVLVEAAFRVKISDSYLFGNKRNGLLVQSNVTSYLAVTGCAIANNIKSGFDITRVFKSAIIAENHIYDNGDGTFNCRIQGHSVATTHRFKVTSNSFWDSRGGSAVTNHLRLNTATPNPLRVEVTENDFNDQSGDAIVRVNNNAGDNIFTRNNPGWNDTKGKVTNPVELTNNTISIQGTTATLSASPVALTVQDANFYMVCTGGTGVTYLVKDPKGNSVESSANSYAKILPVGYVLNVTFTTTPTIAAFLV